MEPKSQAPKKHACPKCGKPLRLLADQVGTEVICPKCQAKFTVGKPDAPKSASKPASQAALDTTLPDDDAYEPEVPLVYSSIVQEDYSAQTPIAPSNEVQYEADWTGDDLEVEEHHARAQDDTDYLEIAKARGLVRDTTREYRPRWTFFSLVFTFPWQAANIGRWAGMSFGMTLAGFALIPAVELIRGGGVATLGAPLLVMAAAILLVLAGAFSAACFLAAIQDTLDGHAEVRHDSLPDWDQWFAGSMGLLNVFVMSGAVGYPLVLVEQIGGIAIPICAFFLFPIFTLSAIDAGSFLLPFSRDIWLSLTRFWWAWLVFYAVSTALVAAWAAALIFGLSVAPYPTMLLAGAVTAAVTLIYARLLGRLGWLFDNASDVPGAEQNSGHETKAKPGKAKRARKRSRHQVRIPDDVDLPTGNGLPPAPRDDFA